MSQSRGSLGKVLVIGSNGFLGHHIVNQLVDSWTTTAVVGVDLRCQRNRNPDAEYHECDITDNDKLTAVFKDISPDVVIHTASPVGNDSKIAHEIFKKVNVDGTQSVIDACQKTGVKGLVYTSSASVMSDNVSDLLNADERWPMIRGEQQTEYYSETKAAAEELVINANRQDASKLLTCAIRPAGIFGEGDAQLLPGLLGAYRGGKSNVQVGDNENLFDFTYVGNIAHAHLLAAQLLLATSASAVVPLDHERVDGEAFIITNDSPVYFWDFARAVWRAAGNPAGTEKVWTLPRGLGITFGYVSEVISHILGRKPTLTRKGIIYSSMTRYYNITKAKAILRYKPLYTQQEGIERGVNWFLEHEQQQAVAAKV
ncbi:3-beta hydroxysteroid dehydrogenase/isomerase family-domain-containing protein [Thelonectria olida]|uniref:Sterol-4-alpha-carboxylate 3-dehydrogenase ERG26, decarboxylating n=1 Tax=Thelonectria olida TaxID=1576542 RepID=A0A9P8WEV6_9HYPO|nr:3-beta hydroxysteroid dehydrogenase/isomerase family-domain-containing protein [Thelonectria olida]